MMDATRIGRRGTVVVPSRPRNSFGMEEDCERACREVCAPGLDPQAIPHRRPSLVAVLGAIGVGVLLVVESAPAADPPQTPSGRDSVLVQLRSEGRALRAMVVDDPDDKRGIHGYFHLAEVYSARMLEPNISRLREGGSGSLLQNPHALQNLVSALNEYTDIDAKVSSRHPFSARELMEVPWIFAHQLTTTLTGMELTSLGRYLASGGFVLADAGAATGGSEDIFIRHSIREALASIVGGAEAGATGTGRNNVDYVVGVEVGGRLAVAITYQNLGPAWDNMPPRNETSGFVDNSRHLQFGINTIVFALTQKGSITQKAMGQTR